MNVCWRANKLSALISRVESGKQGRELQIGSSSKPWIVAI